MVKADYNVTMKLAQLIVFPLLLFGGAARGVSLQVRGSLMVGMVVSGMTREEEQRTALFSCPCFGVLDPSPRGMRLPLSFYIT
ncbi:hypothetical protein B0I37DRAFT_367156 [Chaetomium sp. MPI-CAGE-AT-0009]|nr:hypothetical protein B0I37DRAFT_367156 [Chaetomium sp. MPI-CAGE-AT-0009]